MVMMRRGFLRLAIGALLAAPVRWVARCTVAVRARRYPGPVRPLDEANVRRPGKWAG